MKYVIDCSEKAAAIIRDSLALAGNVKNFDADDALEALGALDKIRPMSELCEEEAKKYEFAEDGCRWQYYRDNLEKFNPSYYEDQEHLLTPAIVALRAFGSNS